jgi:hypothetical protein
MDSIPARRIQFSVATALCVITAVSILCVVARWERGIPYGAILPGVLFVASCYVGRRVESPEMAWGLFAIAWMVTLVGIVHSQIHCFGLISGVMIASNIQRCLLHEFGTGVVLPLFLSLPAVYLAIKASKGTRSYARKWMIACAVIGLVDVTVLTILVGLVRRYAWP